MDTTASAPDEPEGPLPVFVLATTAEPTRHALAVGRALSSDRHATVVLCRTAFGTFSSRQNNASAANCMKAGYDVVFLPYR